MSLVACPTCSLHVLSREAKCPHCGGKLRNDRGVVARTATAALMGLSLTACPAEDNGDDTGAGSATMTAGSSSSSASSTDPSGTSAGSTSSSGPSTASDPSTGSLESDYGVPSTTGFTESSSTGGANSSSSGSEGTEGSSSTGFDQPAYGVVETTDE